LYYVTVGEPSVLQEHVTGSQIFWFFLHFGIFQYNPRFFIAKIENKQSPTSPSKAKISLPQTKTSLNL